MSISFVCRARSVRDGFYSHHTARVKAEENEREGERERGKLSYFIILRLGIFGSRERKKRNL